MSFLLLLFKFFEVSFQKFCSPKKTKKNSAK